jgi:GTP diphosphokinase / guanosine-3',5'-bis(diphosphate) 3'-diphosphatase
VDFAYAVHTDIGNRCVAVKINQELLPLRAELKNGDRVEIITAAHARPNPLWLNFVTTGKARSRIRHFLKTMHFQESAKLGERLLNQALAALGSAPADIKEAQWDKFLRDAGAKSRHEVSADIGLGKRLAAVVARRLLVRGEPGPQEAPVPGSVIIRGSEGMAVQFAHCCRPIPGDPIIGVISKGQGMVIHTHDCPVIAKARHDPDRVLDVSWDPETRKLFEVNIKLVVANQRGVLAKVAAEIAEAGSNIQNVAVDPEDGSSYTNMFFTIQVSNRLHLAAIMRSLRRIPEAVRISRVQG